jgi:hypothetical protein
MDHEKSVDTHTNERIARLEVQVEQTRAHRDDLEMRVRSLERALWVAVGFAAAGGGAVGGLVAHFIGTG